MLRLLRRASFFDHFVDCVLIDVNEAVVSEIINS